MTSKSKSTNARSRRGSGTIQERGGTFWIQTSVTVDGQRQRDRLGPFATRQAAVDAQANRTPNPAGRVFTVGEWLDYWINDHNESLENAGQESSRDIRERHVRLHLKPLLGHIRLEDLTPIQCRNAWRVLLHRDKAPLQFSTIKKVRATLALALDEAMEVKGIESNAARISSLPPRHASEKSWSIRPIDPDKEVFTHHQYAILWKWVISNLLTVRGLAIFIACATGMRVGELMGLKIDDIDFKRNEFTLNTQVLEVKVAHSKKEAGKPKSRLELRPLKTKRSFRTIGVSRDVMRAIRLFIEHQDVVPLQRHRTLFTSVGEPQGSIGNPECLFDPHKLTMFMTNRLATDLGLPRATPHMCRHTHATMILEEGVDIRDVSLRLGHSSQAVTEAVYAHVRPSTNTVDPSAAAWERIVQRSNEDTPPADSSDASDADDSGEESAVG